MKRTMVLIPDDLDARLRFEAEVRGTSIAEVVREALTTHLEARPSTGKLTFLAIGDAGPPHHVSDRVDEYLAEIYERRARERSRHPGR